MKTITATVFFVITLFIQLQAQNIEDWINSKKPLLFEKLYLHVDRELYAPGDIIWMKAYQPEFDSKKAPIDLILQSHT